MAKCMSYGLERGLSARSAIPILRAWHDKQAREREMLKTKLFRAVVEISRDLYEDSRAEMLDGRHTTAALLERTSDAVINDAAAALAEPTLENLSFCVATQKPRGGSEKYKRTGFASRVVSKVPQVANNGEL
jgi:hypothetical protein